MHDEAVFDQLGAEIRRRRISAGLSQSRLAARASMDQRVSVDQALISKTETGTSPPSATLLAVLDDVLAARGALIRFGEHATQRRGPSTDSAGSTRGPRELMTMAARRAREFALSHQAALSAETLEQVYDEVRSLAVAYPQRPLAEILGPLTEAQETVFTLLEQRQRPGQARQLYLLAGVTGGLLAKASHDLAEPLAARTHARTAFVCADNADHDGLRAWVRGLQSLIAYWANRPGDAIHYAQSGSTFATIGTSAVWLPVSEARGWAALGNTAEAKAALGRADQAWDVVSGDDLDDMGGICTFSRARQAYYAADAFSQVAAEAPEQAVEHAAKAVEAYADTTSPEWAFGDQAGSHASLAIGRLALGELDGAVEAIDPVLDLTPGQRINGVVHSVRRVHEAVGHSAVAGELRAGHLREEIEAFTRTPAVALPR